MNNIKVPTKKLFIHCGLHKTATSKFQDICCRNRLLLEKCGVFYPIIKNKNEGIYSRQHSIVARSLSAINTKFAEYFFKAISQYIEDKNCSAVLLSGEDFENILFDQTLLENLIRVSSKFGFQRPSLAFTSRDPFEYFCSIYAALSKKRVLLDFRTAALSASKTGFFACPTNDGLRQEQHFNNFFAIKAEKLIERFSRRFNGLKVIHEPFDSFIDPWPGFNILSNLVDSSCLNLVDIGAIEYQKNKKEDDLKVEINYTQNFLGLGREVHNSSVNTLSQIRLRIRRESEPIIKTLFKDSA